MLNKEELGKKIKELRIRLGVSQENLGKTLNKSHATISYIEKGKIELTVGDLDKIAKALDTSIPELLDITPKFATSFHFYGSLLKQINVSGYTLNIISSKTAPPESETPELKKSSYYAHS